MVSFTLPLYCSARVATGEMQIKECIPLTTLLYIQILECDFHMFHVPEDNILLTFHHLKLENQFFAHRQYKASR